jgi:hypothetical protein
LPGQTRLTRQRSFLDRQSGVGELAMKANYFICSDSAKWQTNVLTYAKVIYEKVDPGVHFD